MVFKGIALENVRWPSLKLINHGLYTDAATEFENKKPIADMKLLLNFEKSYLKSFQGDFDDVFTFRQVYKKTLLTSRGRMNSI